MEALPEIHRRDFERVLNLIRAQSVELAKKECVCNPLRQLGHTTAEDLPELFRLHLLARVASPRCRALLASGRGRRMATLRLRLSRHRCISLFLAMIFGSDQRSCAGGSRRATSARSLALRTSRGRRASRKVSWTASAARSGRTKSEQCKSVQTITVSVDPTLGVDLR